MIDTHVHHWDLGRFRYPWLDDAAFDDLRKDYLPADYRADSADATVEGWVHIQAEVDHQLDPVAETAWVESLAGDARASGLPGPLACVVYADLRSANVREVLSRQCRHPLTRGVRQEAWFDPASTRADIPREDLLSRSGLAGGLSGAGRVRTLIRSAGLARSAPAGRRVAAEVPAVPVVLEHLGLPDPTNDPGLRTWRTGVATLAELPHACVKLSAFSWLGNPRDERAVRAVASQLLELFGPQRCMVGSNFPVERLAGDFGSLYQLVLATLGICPMSNVQTSSPAPHGASIEYRILTPPVPKRRPRSADAGCQLRPVQLPVER